MSQQSADKSGQLFYIALVTGILIHGLIILFTFEGTYDAYVHMFFADHYAENWFENWDYRWYTGFTITSYPPLVHQLIAIFSTVVGLKLGFALWAVLVTTLFIRGIYVFSKLWVSPRIAGYAALLAVFSSSFTEALHLFGQLPSITGIAFLLNACPEVYKWVRFEKRIFLFTGLSILTATSSAHHVTTIFGLVFFIFPVLGLAIYDRADLRQEVDKVHLGDFLRETLQLLPRLIFFGVCVGLITLLVIFPYWYWSKTDPISQVPIPHGSRDSYIEIWSSGLVFFLIPWGMMLFFLPYLFLRVFKKRNLFLVLSILLLFVLGTGGTTPIPKMVLGETAFEILTLDRFTFWATILSIPFWAQFLHSMLEGDFKNFLVNSFSPKWHYGIVAFFFTGIFASSLLIINFGYFKSIQPEKIDIDPIVQFLNRDQHSDWRYMTLGFGDQMAWLSANTGALSVDGNYHSARRLPEMTTRAVERLENAKYLGQQGIGSLQQFLSLPEKYNLKYVFSNDRFYDPLLYFSGWSRVNRLENDIVVWERPDVPRLPTILGRKDIPSYQRYMWGILPLTVLLLALFMSLYSYRKNANLLEIQLPGNKPINNKYSFWPLHTLWIFSLLVFILLLGTWNFYKNHDHSSPENLVDAYFDAIDFKEFKTSYSYFNPDTRPGLEEYMTGISLKSGVLSSYAKLNEIRSVDYISQSDSTSELRIKVSWLTALNAFETDHYLKLTKKGLLWYLEPLPGDLTVPPDQLMRLPEMEFYNQGRRKQNRLETSKEDILDRPKVYVEAANLMKADSNYYIVGKLINMDIDPAYIHVTAILYDEYNRQLLKYNVTDQIIHNLLPKEITPFKIDFSEAFISVKENDPDKIMGTPKRFALYVNSLVTDDELYRSTALQNLDFTEFEKLSGEFMNYGPKEVIIPQLLLLYHQKDDPVWVDTEYLPLGVKSQRVSFFDLETGVPQRLELVQRGNDQNILVNGISRKYMKETLDVQTVPGTEGNMIVRENEEFNIELYINSFTVSIYND